MKNFKKIYALYFHKPLAYLNNYELKISSDDVWTKKYHIWFDEYKEIVIQLNDCVYISPDIEELKKKAISLKEQWIKEEEEKIKTLVNLQIGEWSYNK